MHAQMIELHLESAQRRELMQALREQAGFSGALHLTARERSAALLVVLWETEADAARPLGAWTELLLQSASVTVWEVDGRI